MIAILKQPGMNPEIVGVDNTLDALQKTVDGYIEVVTLASDAAIIVNEEGRINDMRFNCRFLGLELFGPVLFVGVDGENFTDLGLSAVDIIFRALGKGQPL